VGGKSKKRIGELIESDDPSRAKERGGSAISDEKKEKIKRRRLSGEMSGLRPHRKK